MNAQPRIQELRKILREVDQLVGRSGLPVSFNQGIKRADLEALMAQLPFTVPAEVQCIYEWRNGTSCNCSLIPEFRFLPFEDGVFEVRDSKGYRPKGWLPLLTRDGDSFYVDASPRSGPSVRFFWHEGDESSRGASAFDSVQTLFETIAEAYRQEMFVARRTTVTIEHKTQAVTHLEAKDKKTWDALKVRLNPRSAEMWLPQKVSGFEEAMEAIDLHIDELRQYGAVRTLPTAKKLRTEIKCINSNLETLTPMAGLAVRPGSTLDRSKLLDHVRNLQALKEALLRSSHR